MTTVKPISLIYFLFSKNISMDTHIYKSITAQTVKFTLSYSCPPGMPGKAVTLNQSPSVTANQCDRRHYSDLYKVEPPPQ